MDNYEQTILNGWEEVHKKSQLTLWILMALKSGPKFMSEIKDFIFDFTNETISADDQSMYRALRRFYDANLVSYKLLPSDSGPDLKVYSLTNSGTKVLQKFISRNIKDVFYNHDVQILFVSKPLKEKKLWKR